MVLGKRIVENALMNMPRMEERRRLSTPSSRESDDYYTELGWKCAGGQQLQGMWWSCRDVEGRRSLRSYLFLDRHDSKEEVLGAAAPRSL